jgi:hypothetical protein
MKYRHGGFVFGNASAYQKLRKFSTCAGKIIFKPTPLVRGDFRGLTAQAILF